MKKILTYHQLNQFKISPKHYEHYISNKAAQELDRKETIMYDALVALLQSEDEYKIRFIVLKDSSLPFKHAERDKFRKDFAAAYSDKTVIEEYYNKIVLGHAKNIASNKYKSTLMIALRNGDYKQVHEIKDPKTGIFLESYFTWLPKANVMMNLQLCDKASPWIFEKSVFSYGYHNRAAWDIEVMQRFNDSYMIFALEKSDPFVCEAYKLTNESIMIARKENRMLIDILCWCNMHGFYPGYNEFNVLKNSIYKAKGLHNNTFDEVMCELDTFFEINPGYKQISTPEWILN